MSRSARKTAAQVADKWSMNLSNAGTQMKNGASGVTVSPTQLAAQQQNAYLQGVQNAVQSGKWQAALNGVSLPQWQGAYVTKGIPRIVSAATTDKPKVASAFGPLLSYVYDQRDQINSSMPRGSLQQNIQRSQAFIQAMANYRKT